MMQSSPAADLQGALPHLYGEAMQRREARLFATVNLILLGALVTSPLWVSALFFAAPKLGGGIADFILVPVIFLLDLAAIVALSRRDGFQRQTMIMGLLLKLAAVGTYLAVSFQYYGGAADIAIYHGSASVLAQQFSAGNFQLPTPLTGTNFVEVIGGIFYWFFGVSLPSISVAFASAAYWGQYLAYRSFCTAFPACDRRIAGIVLFATPSIVFWNAALGKDALAALFVNLVVYGFALSTSKVGFRAYTFMAAGAVGMLMIRPHIAAMLAIAGLVPFVFGRTRGGISGAAIKIAMIPVLIVGALYVLNGAKDFVELRDVSDTSKVMQRVATSNVIASQGSTFGANQSVAARAVFAPFLPFRPFPWEAHSLLSDVAAIEGFVLLVFTVRRLRRLRSLLSAWRTVPMIGFLAVYCIFFMVAFAGAMTNFGLMARERVMMMPMFLLLLLADGRLLQRVRTVPAGWTARASAAS